MSDARTSSSSSSSTSSDVVIVGCGPVGLTLAILLGLKGQRVTILERWTQPYPLPRACHFDHEVGRILASLGIGDVLRANTEPAEIYEWRNATGQTLLRFGRIGLGPSGWPVSSMFSQPAVEGALEDRARSLPSISIIRGTEVEALLDDDTGVTAITADGGHHRGTFLVGCDGANSTVRTLLGIESIDLGFRHDWLIVDLVLHESRVFDPVNLQICDPARPTTLVSGGPGRRRWEFMRLPGESLEDLSAPERAWELLEPWDISPSMATLERQAVYTFGARYAEHWRQGRILLAGDSAHLMPPFAGQGMCAGVRDAVNLAWKLDLVLEGTSPYSLLDTYEEERRPSVHAAIEFSIELGKVICISDPDEARLRDDAMASVVSDGPTEGGELPGFTSGCIDPTSPGAGTLFVQGTDGGQWLDDLYGTGWRLISLDDPGVLDPEDRAWFENLGGRVIHLTDPGAGLVEWCTSRGVRHVLQRPDFMVFASSAESDGPTRLIATLRRTLTDRPEGAASP